MKLIKRLEFFQKDIHDVFLKHFPDLDGYDICSLEEHILSELTKLLKGGE